MKLDQLKNSGLIIISNLMINLSNFLRQIVLAWFLGISDQIDVLLVAQIVPSIIQSMIGGGAGETSVIKGGDRSRDNNSFMAIFISVCLLLVLCLGCIYFLFIDSFLDLFKLSAERMVLFNNLSVIYIINMVPGTFTSILRPHLYAKGFYKFFTYSSVLSQLAGLIFLLLTLKVWGIYSFALSIILANTLNAIWFSYKAKINYTDVAHIEIWRSEYNDLKKLMKRVFSISIQTIMNHLGTFWERTLSVRFLSGGYLSSLNYSKNLSDLPSTILLSSVLTTSYIEQVRLYKLGFKQFSEFTISTLKTIIGLGLVFQLLLLIFAPLIIIVLFRRGNFDNTAVEATLVIFNILTVSFLPKLIYGYFARTMYILGHYRMLLLAGFLRLLLQVGIMVFFITKIDQAIPFAILSGNIFIVVLLYYMIGPKLQISNWYFFPLQISGIVIVSLMMYRIHSLTLKYYIGKTTFEVLQIYLPIILICSAVLVFLASRTTIGKEIIYKIRKYVNPKS